MRSTYGAEAPRGASEQASGLSRGLERRPLRVRQLAWHHHDDLDEEVAGALVCRHALAAEAEALAGLRAGRDGHLDRLPVGVRDRAARAEDGLDRRDRLDDVEVVALAAEARARVDAERDVEVARRTALSGAPAARDADLDAERTPRGMTRRTGSPPGAGRSVVPPRSAWSKVSWSCASTSAPRTGSRASSLKKNEKTSLPRVAAKPRASGPADAVEEAAADERAMPRAVVGGTARRVDEHLVGALETLEALLCDGVAWVVVRVAGPREPPVRLLDRVGRCRLVDLERLVVVGSFEHAGRGVGAEVRAGAGPSNTVPLLRIPPI